KDVVHRLRGMYAIAIWDTWTRELFCARDPFGIKPFYYRIDRGPGTVSGGEANGAPGGSNGAAPGPGLAPRPRGGRHAAPGPASEPATPEQADPPVPPDGWFTPTARPAGPAGRRLPLLARRPAASPPAQRVDPARDSRRDARLGRGPPAQPRSARGVPVRRHRLGGDLRAGRRAPAGPAHVHRGVRARGVQRDRPGAGDGGRHRRAVDSLRDHPGGVLPAPP